MTYDILIRMKKNPQYLTLHIKTNEAIMKNSWENLSQVFRPKTIVQHIITGSVFPNKLSGQNYLCKHFSQAELRGVFRTQRKWQ